MAYRNDVDYQDLINKAVAQGDYKSAAQYERVRNEKIADLDKTGTNTYGATATNKYSQYLNNNAFDNVYTWDNEQSALLDKAKQNSLDWWGSDAAGQKVLSDANKQIFAELGPGINYNSQTGTWGGVADKPISMQTGVDFEMPTFDIDSYMASNPKPTYESQYSERIDALLNQILNREKFSYDVETDSLYQQYKKQYTREGNRAMNDTLAAMASGAGGMNTWAATAAQQANDYYMAQLGDKIPELYQLAYSMYLDDIAGQRSDLSMLQGLDNTDYSRYRDDVTDWYSDRDFAFNDYRYDMEDYKWGTEFNYNAEQDEYDKEWQKMEWDYNAEWKQKEWDHNLEREKVTDGRTEEKDARDLALEMLMLGEMPSPELLEAAGISPDDAESILDGLEEPVVPTPTPVAGTGNSKKSSGSTVQKPNADKPSNVQAYTDTGTGTSSISDRAKQIAKSLDMMRDQNALGMKLGGKDNIANSIAVYVEEENLSEADARWLFKRFGYNPDDWLEEESTGSKKTNTTGGEGQYRRK